MTKRLTFHERLYLGESIVEKKLDKLKKTLEKTPLLSKVYLLVIAGNPTEQLEFFEARQLAQPYYRKQQFLVVGIASDYSEAVDLVEKIVKDCICARSDCNLREFFAC